MKYVTFILTLGLIGVFLTACVQAGPGTSSAAVPAVTLREEVERYPGGQIHTRYTYYLGLAGRRVKHGLEKAYQQDGQLIYQEEYRDGLMDGEEFRFHIDGALASHTRWDQGKQTGLAQGWHETGELQWQATYRDGKIVGEKLWLSDGVVVCKETYGDDGKLAKKVGLYPRARGEQFFKWYEGNYRSGVMHGTWTFWYSDGSIKAVGEWKDGKPWNGVCGIPAAGDAGSWGGILVFNDYKNGKNLGRAKLPPEPQVRPKGKP